MAKATSALFNNFILKYVRTVFLYTLGYCTARTKNKKNVYCIKVFFHVLIIYFQCDVECSCALKCTVSPGQDSHIKSTWMLAVPFRVTKRFWDLFGCSTLKRSITWAFAVLLRHCAEDNTSNSNRTEWSPIRSNRTTAERESDLFITSMITDRIGRHEVL